MINTIEINKELLDIKSLLSDSVLKNTDKLFDKLNNKYKNLQRNISFFYASAYVLNTFKEEDKKLIKRKLKTYLKSNGILREKFLNKQYYCAIGAISNILYSKELGHNTIKCNSRDLNNSYNEEHGYFYVISHLNIKDNLLREITNYSKYKCMNINILKPLFVLNDRTDITFKELSQLIILDYETN